MTKYSNFRDLVKSARNQTITERLKARLAYLEAVVETYSKYTPQQLKEAYEEAVRKYA